MLQVVLRRRTKVIKSEGVPSNQIWYDAPSKVTLYSETDVISHTFGNGRGIITFNNNITEVKDWLRRASITNVYFPNSIVSIGNNAFAECNKLALISLPEGITSIGSGAFLSCSNLALTSLPVGITYINDNAFAECSNLALTSLPAGITSIGHGAFQNCSNLALTYLPAGITSIDYAVFSGCSKLALTSLPSGVTSIGNSAFSGCSKLALTYLPSGVTRIDTGAFYECIGIPKLTIPISTPPTLGNVVFSETTFPIYVPASAVNTYKTATNWSKYANRISAIQ